MIFPYRIPRNLLVQLRCSRPHTLNVLAMFHLLYPLSCVASYRKNTLCLHCSLGLSFLQDVSDLVSSPDQLLTYYRYVKSWSGRETTAKNLQNRLSLIPRHLQGWIEARFCCPILVWLLHLLLATCAFLDHKRWPWNAGYNDSLGPRKVLFPHSYMGTEPGMINITVKTNLSF